MPLALEVIAGVCKGQTLSLPEDQAVTIGRDSANSYRVKDRKLSRIHCQFEVIGGRCQITDLNSTNGTTVNNKEIENETWLIIGDEVQIGKTELRLIEISEEDASNLADLPGEAPEDETPGGPICEECGAGISENNIATGNANRVGDRYYCSKCAVTFDQVEITTDKPEPADPEPPRGLLGIGDEVVGVRIIAPICEGRMGHIYKGEQISMGRIVTLKMLRVDDSDWAQKYLNAVYSSGQLVHQNIALIFDTGEENGSYYLVREYVEGKSVEIKLAGNRPLLITEAYDIITQALYAVEHAAEREIVHGQLSPRKILVAQNDVVKLTGFGLPLQPPRGTSKSTYQWHTLPYTAPERFRSDRPAALSGDVYSAVAIFYHMVTGRPPFSGSTREKIEKRILRGQPAPLSQHLDHVPEAAQKIIDRGLFKDPLSRYQTSRELLYDLEENLRRQI